MQIEVEGRTLKDAMDRACETLGISRYDLQYRLDPDHFRQGMDSVRVIAWLRSASDSDLPDRARDYLKSLFTQMDLEIGVEIEADENIVKAIVMTEDAELFSGKGRHVMEAIEYLVNKALIPSSSDRRILIDMESFRERRESNLKVVARKVCERVLEDHSTITLKPMNAYDRRLVHLEVSLHDALESRSLGDGSLKRVQIFHKAGTNNA